MNNSKRIREPFLKQAREDAYKVLLGLKKPNVCFTCKSCWRRSLQADLNNLQCPFCGSAMYEVRQ